MLSEWFQSLGPVQWFRDQFAECPENAVNCESISAPDLFQFVLLAWLVAAIALIALDRLGSGLFGRSRPLAQEPPMRARTWRWGRQTPPENYSLLPPGTTVSQPEPPALTMELVDRPALTTGGSSEPVRSLSNVDLPGPEVPNATFWKALSLDTAPLFGLENHGRLEGGLPPERYNPVSGRVESLQRDDSGQIRWPFRAKSTTAVGVELDDASSTLMEDDAGSSVFSEEEE